MQFYIVSSNLSLFSIEEKSSSKYLYLKKSIKAWIKLQKYNKGSQNYSTLADSINSKIHAFSETNYIQSNRRKVLYLHNTLAEVFSDTTDTYRSIHYVAPKTTAPIIDHSIANIRQEALKNAEFLIGVPYKYGGIDSTGFDCSGFTQYVYKSIGIEIPHNANEQSKLGKTIRLNNAKPGDLIFFGNSRAFHAGMIFNNKDGEIELIHCVSGGVHHQNYENQNTKYWLQRVYKVQRIIED